MERRKEKEKKKRERRSKGERERKKRKKEEEEGAGEEGSILSQFDKYQGCVSLGYLQSCAGLRKLLWVWFIEHGIISLKS